MDLTSDLSVDPTAQPFRVCFVCLGNICRSPTAEGVMQWMVGEAGLEHRIHVESAGTAGYHTGASPDDRSAAEALRHGIDISHQRSRQFHAGDFAFFDLVVAMDESNLTDLVDLAPDQKTADRVRRLREFDPTADSLDVPDPYYESGFDGVFAMVERSCRGLLDVLTQQLPEV